ncbi:prepilin-type N-terminal cleavage/methylation domain-containing protein [Fibrobacter sp. UWCM]|uniref:prepilin-type N-terminal cleavage/methylation domain-containing protein n=1 Tax=Fibrobacter sp. UWCM TaxID=1896208 RepID=UPI00091B39C3|nr:prepilin-type N-terminal cleavage/methylation domain-containing protein [Fibrobacter sp. UWCM]SHH07001.1 prepilin-type N-terminal cleavage/methylation domain-containing protein [Fibrobacter sp. UWCM]
MVNCSRKLGFTLVEVLVVVAIMGILSGIGVASLRSAVANSRIKDAGINVTAFMQRAANEATRLNEKLAVNVESGNKTLRLYKCNAVDGNGICTNFGDTVDEMTLESSNAFVTDKNCPDLTGAKTTPATVVTLVPKIGVSPIPTSCLMVRYGGTDRYAVSIKSPTKFSMYYELSYNSGAVGSWFEP